MSEKTIKDLAIDAIQYLTSTLEALATQIGVTVKEIYPYYVKQQFIQGLCVMIVLVLGFLLFLGLFLWMGITAPKWGEQASFEAVMAIVFGSATVGFFIGFLCNVSEHFPKVFNPHYSAIKQLIEDLKDIAKFK